MFPLSVERCLWVPPEEQSWSGRPGRLPEDAISPQDSLAVLGHPAGYNACDPSRNSQRSSCCRDHSLSSAVLQIMGSMTRKAGLHICCFAFAAHGRPSQVVHQTLKGMCCLWSCSSNALKPFWICNQPTASHSSVNACLSPNMGLSLCSWQGVERFLSMAMSSAIT